MSIISYDNTGDREEYVVEKILQMQMHDNRRYYLIKWEGYPESESTWEPEENCHCPELIDEFWEKNVGSSMASSTSYDSDSENEVSSVIPRLSKTSYENYDRTYEKQGGFININEDSDTSDETSDGNDPDYSYGQDGFFSEKVARLVTRTQLKPNYKSIFSPDNETELDVSAGIKGDEETLADLNIIDTDMEEDEVVGITIKSNELHYLLKCHVTGKIYALPSSVASVRCPQAVIKFLETKITFKMPANCSSCIF